LKFKHITGVNCSQSETDIKQLLKDGGKKLVYAFHSSPVKCDTLKILDPHEQIENAIRAVGSEYAAVCMVNPLDTALSPEKDAVYFRKAVQINNLSIK
jgi:hypothetical protein